MMSHDGWRPLIGKIALVTGAGRARGIGRAIALRLAECGADVAVADIARRMPQFEVEGIGLGESFAELEETADLIRSMGRKSVAVAIDIADHDSVREGVMKVTTDLGPIDILVNNAGSAVGTAAFEKITDAEWEISLRVNVLGAVNMTRAVLASMKERRSGTIVNMASTLGVAALAEYGSYVVSKHAVVGLTRLLAQELAPMGIRVNAVAPGYIDTDMGRAEQAKIAVAKSLSPESVVNTIVGEIPIGRMGTPEDVAEAVAWLADPAASFVNGAIIPVHGGQIPGYA
ncbi:SDR family oxidoreductase [Ochrobactrum sp. SFR4]|uniref:SDR family NAD(P)-dependent oxidoreductase n=1 Tax=Ochrobactrum sp. SFR4 TaxID=2717368 RepID=UPI001C8BAAE0|nr:SDR family oxidoreductase [Ochrobactrum sp. SFR4]MBX8827349.1 SDR family oxidoreductase [Ochrobactrum sp. SFR4]